MERKKENYLFVDDMILYEEKLLEQKNLEELQNIKSTHKNQLHFYKLTMNNSKMKLRNYFHQKIKNKTLQNKLCQAGKGLVQKNHKTLLVEFKENINK